MNLNNVIKKQRSRLSLSQEELAEKLYVTRHTIGNWENNRSYPDVHNLIQLSQVFGMTIDNLVKGDLEIMQRIIEEKDIRYLKRNFISGLVGIIIGLPLLFVTQMIFYFGTAPYFIGLGIGLVAGLAGVSFIWKCDRIEKKYDVQTFREIIAFSKGETLDEIAKAKELGKRPYQLTLFVIIALMVATGIYLILWHFSPNQHLLAEILQRLR